MIEFVWQVIDFWYASWLIFMKDSPFLCQLLFLADIAETFKSAGWL